MKILPAKVPIHKNMGLDKLVKALATTGDLPEGAVGLTEDNRRMFPGATLYALKATHGLPLAFSLSKILENGMAVDWVAFVEAARKDGRWDYQTYADVKHGLADAEVRADYAEAVCARLQQYIMSTLRS